MKRQIPVLLLLVCSLAVVGVAQTLYTTTDGQFPGSLYSIALDGTPTLVGPLLDAANHTFSITGLAQFGNGPVYGVTANLSPTSPRSLVTLNLTNGRVTVIGSLGLTNPQGPVNDIVFLTNGTLFGYAPKNGQFVTINTSTGAATLIGSTGSTYSSESLAVSPIALTFTGSIGATGPTGPSGPAPVNAPANAVRPRASQGLNQTQTTLPAGTVYSTTGGPCGELDWINPATGAITPVMVLSYGNCNFGITGLRFSSSGTLYCTLTELEDPFLATIGLSGAVTTIGNGSVPAGVGSLAFASQSTSAIPVVSTPVLLAMIAGLLLLGLLHFRRMQTS